MHSWQRCFVWKENKKVSQDNGCSERGSHGLGIFPKELGLGRRKKVATCSFTAHSTEAKRKVLWDIFFYDNSLRIKLTTN